MLSSLDTFVAVPLSNDLYLELVRRYPGGVSSVLEQVAQDFLDRTAGDFAAREPPTGVYWGALFLPSGTQVRTKYFDEYIVGEIVDEKIMWGERAYPSMSRLASAMRGDTSNNAWKVLEVKRPTDQKFQAALAIRRR